ncbi:hypothetical protein BIV57_03735 [Mangrovactinospora gilvigrisea]|uniref:Nucleic acid/nucleotide deaminase of polymorphic system toxin n=1 Tax=Mangrovactinospora gilvigrisea TaxID=1428644 RepID=A0A1J7CGR6_9ACTN|nr:SUKH-4 family immunity protein [Mangrovactinospora gilvigrisea]OIV38858.1 hypothetical protein BIV57_03735 [Mangrovactinospora gilvigrisea]
MADLATARERAETWINGEVPSYLKRTVRLQEFSGGFVAWGETPGGGSEAEGARMRMVVDRSSGEATLWPGLPVDEVIRRWEESYGHREAPPEPVAPESARSTAEATSFLIRPPELGGPQPAPSPVPPTPAPMSAPMSPPVPPPVMPPAPEPGPAPAFEPEPSFGGSSGLSFAKPSPAAPEPEGSLPMPPPPAPAPFAPAAEESFGTGSSGLSFAKPAGEASGAVPPPLPAPGPAPSLDGGASGLSFAKPAGEEGARPTPPPPPPFASQGGDSLGGASSGGLSFAKPTGEPEPLGGDSSSGLSFAKPAGESGAVPPPLPAPGPAPSLDGGASGLSFAKPAGEEGARPTPPPPPPFASQGGDSLGGASSGGLSFAKPAGQPAPEESSSRSFAPPEQASGAPVPPPPPGPVGGGRRPPSSEAATELMRPDSMPGLTPPPAAPQEDEEEGPQQLPTMFASPLPDDGPEPPPAPPATVLAPPPGPAPSLSPAPPAPGPAPGPAPEPTGTSAAPPLPRTTLEPRVEEPPAAPLPAMPPGTPAVGPGYLAVLRYRAQDGSEQQIIHRSELGKPHPEWRILHELRQQNVQPHQVLELHTELECCSLPGGYCSRMVRETWPNVRVSHTAPYGRDHASRQQGVQHLQEHHGELATHAEAPQRPAAVRVPLPAPGSVQKEQLPPPEVLTQQLQAAFGPQRVHRWEQRAVARQGVPEVVAHVLVWVGLPAEFAPFFWPQAQPGRPVPTLGELAQEQGVQAGPNAATYLVLGNDWGRQLCVEYGTAHIVAVDMQGGPEQDAPRFVNSGIVEFARCLAILGEMWPLRLGLNPYEAGRWTTDLQARLVAADPQAMSAPDTWWAVLVEQMWDGLL